MYDSVLKNKTIRAALFSHFDRDNVVDDYVVYYLNSLRKVCNYLVFISSSALTENEVSKIARICDRIITRENAGSDFMNHKAGLGVLSVKNYDELILCNDSVYGPLFPLEEIFAKMKGIKCDFWGITESSEMAYHLQSYFLVFRKKVLESSLFARFWDDVTILKRQDIIEKYEIGISQLLLKNGFKSNAYIKYRPTVFTALKSRSVKQWFQWIHKEYKKILARLKTPWEFANASIINPTHYFWRQLIAAWRMPFVKVNLLRDNPMNMNLNGFDTFLASLSDYDINLIKRHTERMRSR